MSVTANPNAQGSLSANTVLEVDTKEGFSSYEIMNVSGATRIDYTLDGSTPVVNGGTSTGRVLPAVAGFTAIVNVNNDGTTKIKLISSGTPSYSVQVVDGSEAP